MCCSRHAQHESMRGAQQQAPAQPLAPAVRLAVHLHAGCCSSVITRMHHARVMTHKTYITQPLNRCGSAATTPPPLANAAADIFIQLYVHTSGRARSPMGPGPRGTPNKPALAPGKRVCSDASRERKTDPTPIDQERECAPCKPRSSIDDLARADRAARVLLPSPMRPRPTDSCWLGAPAGHAAGSSADQASIGSTDLKKRGLGRA